MKNCLKLALIFSLFAGSFSAFSLPAKKLPYLKMSAARIEGIARAAVKAHVTIHWKVTHNASEEDAIQKLAVETALTHAKLFMQKCQLSNDVLSPTDRQSIGNFLSHEKFGETTAKEILALVNHSQLWACPPEALPFALDYYAFYLPMQDISTEEMDISGMQLANADIQNALFGGQGLIVKGGVRAEVSPLIFNSIIAHELTHLIDTYLGASFVINAKSRNEEKSKLSDEKVAFMEKTLKDFLSSEDRKVLDRYVLERIPTAAQFDLDLAATQTMKHLLSVSRDKYEYYMSEVEGRGYFSQWKYLALNNYDLEKDPQDITYHYVQTDLQKKDAPRVRFPNFDVRRQLYLKFKNSNPTLSAPG